jgi:transcriptional regulator with XRE-family HTH domain
VRGDVTKMHFGAKLKYVMEYLGLSTNQMADKLGIDPSYIRHMARNENRKLDHDKILLLQKMSGFPLEFFLDENVKTPNEVAPTEELAKAMQDELELISLIRDEGLTKEEALEILKTVAKLKRRE